MSEFLTRDIKIETDSVGYMTAEHKHQGILIESGWYGSRKECSQAAVEILKDKKNEIENDYEAEERRLEREAESWRWA